MPELPDVALYKKYLDATSLHQYISDVMIRESRIFVSSPDQIRRTLEHHSFDHSRQVGKNLFVKIKSNGYLLLHFGMTGNLKYYKNGSEKPDHMQMRISFSNDYHLAYINKRKLGKVELTESIKDYMEKHDIGPDVSSLDKGQFRELLSGRKGKIKTAMMDQSLFSGLGNVYVDEILYHMDLHPETKVSDLDTDLIGQLYTKTMNIMKAAIDHEADPEKMPESWLLPHREEGASCPSCSGKIKKIKVNGRGTYICPACQKK